MNLRTARELTEALRTMRAGPAPKVRKRGTHGTQVHKRRNIRDARRAGSHPDPY